MGIMMMRKRAAYNLDTMLVPDPTQCMQLTLKSSDEISVRDDIAGSPNALPGIDLAICSTENFIYFAHMPFPYYTTTHKGRTNSRSKVCMAASMSELEIGRLFADV